jgi:hypothetical protein
MLLKRNNAALANNDTVIDMANQNPHVTVENSAKSTENNLPSNAEQVSFQNDSFSVPSNHFPGNHSVQLLLTRPPPLPIR